MNKDSDINRNEADGGWPTGPASAFTHPDQVLQSDNLTVADKRGILAAWASDAHAVPNLPAMRQLDSGAIVSIDAVLTALRELDEARDNGTPKKLSKPSARRMARALDPRWVRQWARRDRDDDDDPPPCPATALPPGGELVRRRRALMPAAA